jgi:hypothetical protein
MKKPKHIPALISLFILTCGLIAACGLLPSLPAPAAAVGAGPTITPLPTSTGEEYPTVDNRSCLIGELIPLRVENPQGDLLAWQPDSQNLAYAGPAASSNWYAGSLHMASGPEFIAPLQLAPEALIFGDLTWSPSGDQLAFTALRISDGVYTVMTVSPQGGPAQDWMQGEAAHTDGSSSQKAIVGWQAGSLRVLSACGPDCDQILQINLGSGQISQVGEQIRRAKDRLAPHTNLTTYDEETYPYMLNPNWSPDLSKIVYFDEDDRTMLLTVASKDQFILDMNIDIETPREAKWADDNRTLAVRTDDRIYIFDIQCK